MIVGFFPRHLLEAAFSGSLRYLIQTSIVHGMTGDCAQCLVYGIVAQTDLRDAAIF